MAEMPEWACMAGYAIIVWDENGVGRAVVCYEDGPVPKLAVPSFCEEAVRRDLIYEGTE